MKKYIILTALTITLGGALAGCKAGKDIGQEEAKKAAFQDAGIKKQKFPEFGFPRNRMMGCYLMT